LATQLFTETLLLSAFGALGAFFLARWTLDLLFRFQPNVGVTFTLDTSADLNVLLVTSGAALLASFLFGLLPALAVTRSEITSVLKGAVEKRGKRRIPLGGGLVAFQMAVSVILLTGSSLFLHSLLEARSVDPGFDPTDAVAVQMEFGRNDIPEEEWNPRADEIRRYVRSQPGIEVLGTSDGLPLLNRNTVNLEIPGFEVPEGGRQPWATRYAVDEGYLDAMGIPLISGRGIRETDGNGEERVVLVNQFAANRYWPEESAVGKSVTVGEVPYRVVGVVGDVKIQFLSDPPEPTIYFSLAQQPAPGLFFVARGNGDAGEMLTGVRRAMLEVDPDLLIMLSHTLEDRVGINLYPVRLACMYLGSFGALALILAAIGLYGVVSLSVSRRTREVGIRMSVGADAGRVVAMVLRGSLGSVVLGGLIGLALALLLGRLIESFLFGVRAADPATLVAVPLLLGAVALLAAYLPARRASQVDPLEALRTE
jgi:predicted permease